MFASASERELLQIRAGGLRGDAVERPSLWRDRPGCCEELAKDLLGLL